MRNSVSALTFILIFFFYIGLCFAKQQRYNPNSDFLLHEAGGIPSAPKRDYAAPQPSNVPPGNLPSSNQGSGKRDYVAQFPALGSTSAASTHFTPSPINTNNPQTQRPQPSGKRDYVAPQFPALGSTSAASTYSTANPILSMNNVPTRKPQSSGKRDYVAPQFPALKPSQGNAQPNGNVKDLINFYDNMNKQNNPQNTPSYSSILQGTTNKQNSPNAATTKFMQPVTPSTPKVTSTLPTVKPLSFSDIVAGSKKPGSVPTIAVSQPTTKGPQTTPQRPTTHGSNKRPLSTSRPGNPVLPSTLVNNKVNTNVTTDIEIQTLSEELLKKDSNNAAKYVTINYQAKTTSMSKEDKAPLPLLTIAANVWNIPTIEKFVPLLDNYERDTLVNEYVTPQERNEENAFMDTIMSTSVIRHLMNFLKDKGYVSPDPKQQRDFLKQLWFGLYSRGKGKISSSGFEHIFVSESKNQEVLGLHNWIYFAREEAANRVNYLGYLKYAELNDKGAVMKFHFNQQGLDKPVDSMFVGTSPELEIALYTVCFLTRPNDDCKLKLANKDVEIRTYTFRYRSKDYIGSGFPDIRNV